RRLYICVKKYVETTNIGIEPEEKKPFNLKSFVSGIITKISTKISEKKKKSVPVRKKKVEEETLQQKQKVVKKNPTKKRQRK
ncbi:MAG: hypothetical protein J6K91_02600, partial [Opitutales bacterium]|nr:hypothetical protein [Opitutales bacterium]